MKTFLLRNGDLTLGPSGFALVTGPSKVKQDLGVAVSEPFGCDRFHTQWGTVLPTVIGGVINEEATLLVRSEITRVVSNYIAVQTDQVVSDYSRGRRARVSANEVVTGIKDIIIRADFDRLYVKILITTAAEDEVMLTTTVGV